jgi:hypothetical protein
MKNLLQRRMSTVATLVVIAGSAVLATLAYFAWGFVQEKMIESKVRALLPAHYGDIRARRDELVSAIEAYKKHFGVYPPDHVLSRQPLVVDPVTNQLLYELVGATYNPTNKTFDTGIVEPVEVSLYKEVFNTDEIKNSSTNSNEVRHFIPANATPYAFEAHDDPDVFVMSQPVFSAPLIPLMTDMDSCNHIALHLKVGSWHYLSTSPTHNPGAFDLWIDTEAYGQQLTIGNWKEVK